MIFVEVLGAVLILTGLLLLVVPRLSSASSLTTPLVTINAPASILVLIVGVGVFLFPYSPWWPGEVKPSPSPSSAIATPSPAAPSPSQKSVTAPPSQPEESVSPSVATAVVLPANVVSDCIPYDPATLSIEDLGATGWRLNSSTSAMVLTDTQADAQKVLALARLHTQQCFIGRDNHRSDRFQYIANFWTGPSGTVVQIPDGAISKPDCIPYNPKNLSIENLGSTGWRLNSGSMNMVLADTEQDANKLLALARNYDRQCFIGRDNTRSDRIRYIVDYWS